MSRLDAPERAARLPVGDEKRAMVREMFDAVAPRYDVLNRIISMGLDISWRKRSVKALGLRPGSLVLDLACGTGDLSRILTRRCLVAVGVDMSEGMLRESRTGTPVVLGDAVSLPFEDGVFDGAVCGFAAQELHRHRVGLLRDRPGRTSRGADRDPRGRDPVELDRQGRVPDLVRSGRPLDRTAALGSWRLPVPSGFGRVPAATRTVEDALAGLRVQVGRSPDVQRRSDPALDRDRRL